MNCYYIVAAAGLGKRMGLDYPKQFLEYKGKPVFMNVLETLENNDLVTGIIVVTGKNYIDKVKELCKEYLISKVINVVEGGKERQDSIYNGLKEIKDEKSIIGVQDGVRPFLKDKYIKDTYNILIENEEIDGAVIAVKVKDTIKIIDEKNIIKTSPIRESLIAAQTPQVFRTDELKKAYRKAYEDKFKGTDDSSLMERLDKKIYYLDGDYGNIKITTPEDLDFLERD